MKNKTWVKTRLAKKHFYKVLLDIRRNKNSRGEFTIQLLWAADYWSHVFSLACPVAEFSFKEIRRRVQSKISSCCVSDRCESREMGCRGRSRLPTLMVESFSTDLLRVIKSYWTEPPFELCLLLGE